jgi:polyisoprenoid-binding protein YceI
MKLLPLSIAVSGILAVSAAVAADAPATLSSVKPGEYVVDPYHTQIGFTLSHFGFTNYTGLFSGVREACASTRLILRRATWPSPFRCSRS